MMRRKKDTGPDAPKVKLSRSSFREAMKMYPFYRPYRWQYIIGLVLLFISSMVFMVFPWAMGKMLDIAQGEAKVEYTLPQMALFLGIVLAVQAIVSYSRVMLFAQTSERGTADLRQGLYEKIMSLPMVFFEKNRVGDLVSRVTNDLEKLYNVFYFVLAEFLRQSILLIGGIIFIAFTTPKLAFIMLGTFPPIVIGAMFFGRYIRKMSKQRQETLAETNTILDETLQSIQAVKAYSNEAFEFLRYGKVNKNVVDISLKFASARALFTVFIVTMLFGGIIFVVWMGMQMVESKTITGGEFTSFIMFTLVIGASIGSLGNFYAELIGALGATERIREILETEDEAEHRKGGIVSAPKFEGAIRFSGVQFAYPTRPDVPVLKDINFQIKAGETVALVGQSGAGKSTIMQLLMQFHYPDSGTIEVDGTNIQEFELRSFRKNFATVPQEVILFGGTIKENILYGNTAASDAEIQAAAERANAWEFIQKFPEGFDTLVGERGIKLSGGQRQRIAIARAILANPAVLLLDEATSSLDSESEKLVQEALDRLMQGRTSIVIAHRLSTIRDADAIYVLDSGLIKEKGTHSELAQLDNGIYKSLAKLQFDQVM